ncbi:MAG: hypothetical protein ACSHX5_06630 [Phycisphaerales bacterium]
MIVSRKKIDPCLPEGGDAWSQLEEGVHYRVIEISYEYYYIQTNYIDWKPTLYNANLFDVIDATVEPEWEVDMGFDLDGEQHLSIGFPEFYKPGFWEDVHDNKPEAHQILIPIFKRLGLTHP